MSQDGDFLWTIQDRSKTALGANPEFGGLLQGTLKRFLFENNTPELQRKIQAAMEETLASVRDRAMRRYLDATETHVQLSPDGTEITVTIVPRDAVSRLGDLEREDEQHEAGGE